MPLRGVRTSWFRLARKRPRGSVISSLIRPPFACRFTPKLLYRRAVILSLISTVRTGGRMEELRRPGACKTFRALDIKVHHDGLLPAAHDDSLDRMFLGRVHLLMGDKGRHVHKVAGAGFAHKFEPLAPAKTGASANDIKDRFKLAVMMGTCAGVGLHHDGTRPELLGAGASMRDGRSAGHTGRLGRVVVQLSGGDDADALRS